MQTTGSRGDAPALPAIVDPVAGRRLVVVPREVGPLMPVDTGADRQPDDLDLLVDEMLGPPPTERPGALDVALMGGGAAVLAWALIAGAAPWVGVLAVAAIVIGAALPARSLVLRYRDTAVARRVRSAGRHGYVLDVSDASTSDLAAAYSSLLEAARGSGSIYADRARDAAHAAVVEAATLLGGAVPDGAEQRAYVTARSTAIAGLASLLAEAGRRTAERARAREQAEEARRRRWLDAVTQARGELQAEDRQGSLARLDRVSRRLRQEQDDADA